MSEYNHNSSLAAWCNDTRTTRGPTPVDEYVR